MTENTTFLKKLLTKLKKAYIIVNVIFLIFLHLGGKEMFEKFKELLVNELQIKEDMITLDAELASDLGINSIELADLVMIIVTMR